MTSSCAAAPQRARRNVVTMLHSTETRAVRSPFLSFISEAVPEASVMATRGTDMNIPRLIRYDDTAESIPAVSVRSPKRSAVASPMRSAAI